MANKALEVIRKTAKYLGVALLFLAIAGGAVLLYLQTHLDSFIKDKLTGLVHDKSKGLYNLQIQSLDFSLSDFSLRAEDILLTTDSSRYAARLEGPPEPMLLHIQVDSFRVSRIDLWSLLWGDGIHIPSIAVADPDISVVAHPRKQKFSLQSLHSSLQKYTPWLEIDRILVRDGTLKYVLKQASGETVARVPDFRLSLHDVLIDEGAYQDTNRILYTKNIIFRIGAPLEVVTPNHTVTVKDLVASTARGMHFEQVVVTTDSAGGRQNYIRASVPRIAIGYLDWRKLLKDEGLYSPKVYLESPRTVVVAAAGSHSHDTSGTQTAGTRVFYEQVTQYVPQVAIDTLLVRQGSLAYQTGRNAQSTRVEAEDYYFRLGEVLLDSTAIGDTSRFLFAKTLALRIDGHVLVDSPSLRIRADSLFAAPATGITAQGVHLSSRSGGNGPSFRATIPFFEADFTDWKSLVLHRGVYVPAVRVASPNLQLATGGNNRSSSQEQHPLKDAAPGLLSLHRAINQYVPWLKIGAIRVTNGHALYTKRGPARQTVQVDDFSLVFRDVLVSAGAARNADRFLYSKNVRLHVADQLKYTSRRHQMNIDRLTASTDRGIRAKQIRFRTNPDAPDGTAPRLLFDVSVPDFFAAFTEWGALTHHEGVSIPLVEVEAPAVTVIRKGGAATAQSPDSSGPALSLPDLHQLLTPYVPWVKVDALTVRRGEGYFVKKSPESPLEAGVRGASVFIKEVEISEEAARAEDRTFYAKSIDMRVRDSLYLATGGYQFGAGQLRASTEEGIRAEQLQLRSATDTTDTRMALAIPSLFIAFTEWMAPFRQEGVAIPVISVTDPSLALQLAGGTTATPAQPSQGIRSLHRKLTPYVPWLTVDSVAITGADATVTRPDRSGLFPARVQDLALLLQNVRLDSAAANAPDRVLYTRQIQLGVDQVYAGLQDSLYSVRLSGIDLSTDNQSLRVNHFAVTPRFNVAAFYERAGGQQDIYRVKVNDFLAEGINFKQLVRNQNLVADLVKAGAFNVKIYRDRSVSSPNEQQRPMPQEAFRNLGAYVRLDSVQLNDGYISYTELLEKDLKPGTVFFEDVHIALANITNDSLLASRSPAVGTASGELMGKGFTHVSLSMPIYDPRNAFTFRGLLTEMRLPALNPALKHMAFIRARSGSLDELVLQMKGDERQATGILCAFYRDFSVELLDQQPGSNDPLLKDITTFLANKVILNHTNRRGRRTFNPGNFEVKREEDQAFANYVWSSIRSGIFSSIGYKKAKKIIPFL